MHLIEIKVIYWSKIRFYSKKKKKPAKSIIKKRETDESFNGNQVPKSSSDPEAEQSQGSQSNHNHDAKEKTKGKAKMFGNRNQRRDSSSSSESNGSMQREHRGDKMPMKKYSRIFGGISLTLLLVSPFVVSIYFGYNDKDSTKYVFHQIDVIAYAPKEVRVIQVTISTITA